MTADKPEAGRTYDPWCGGDCGDQYHDRCWGDVMECWCSPGCEAAGRPLSPAPRPVEPHADAHPGHDPFFCHDGCPSFRQPRPVERCSCAEASRYKAALDDIIAECDSKRTQKPLAIKAIARRALALGEENGNDG